MLDNLFKKGMLLLDTSQAEQCLCMTSRDLIALDRVRDSLGQLKKPEQIRDGAAINFNTIS